MSEKTKVVLGRDLFFPLRDGRNLCGMACPEHGLQYSQITELGGNCKPDLVRLHNGARRPQFADKMQCTHCGAELVGPVIESWHQDLEAPASVWHELLEVVEESDV
jgi:hypothetical protein